LIALFKKIKTSSINLSKSYVFFAPNTPVTTATGLTAIAALTIGTPVLAYNEATGDTGYYAVTQTHKNQDQDITYLDISGEAIETTSNHPFYLEKQVDNSQRPIIKGHETLSKRWVGAGDLKPGDTIRKANGASGVVQFVKTVKERSVKYNLSVDAAHTYFVGGGQWLVHNTGADPCPTVLYHYTDDAGFEGITSSGQLRPSLKEINPKDARYGDGQYLTDIAPDMKTRGQLSKVFYGVPYLGQRLSKWIAIDVTGLQVVKGRDGVFVILGRTGLDISSRIVTYGSTVPWKSAKPFNK
jgi:hypothetical protein